MITEDFVSFETAKLLKEKGFDGKCYKVWVHYTSSTPMLWASPDFVEGETIVDRESVESEERTWNMIYRDSENKYQGYLAPTPQMAMKWLREVHNIGIFPTTFYRHTKTFDGHDYGCTLVNLKTFDIIGKFEDCTFPADSYEETCESAIKYCLENLI